MEQDPYNLTSVMAQSSAPCSPGSPRSVSTPDKDTDGAGEPDSQTPGRATVPDSDKSHVDGQTGSPSMEKQHDTESFDFIDDFEPTAVHPSSWLPSYSPSPYTDYQVPLQPEQQSLPSFGSIDSTAPPLQANSAAFGLSPPPGLGIDLNVEPLIETGSNAMNVPAPQMLYRDIDPTQYEIVSLEEWAMARTDYDDSFAFTAHPPTPLATCRPGSSMLMPELFAERYTPSQLIMEYSTALTSEELEDSTSDSAYLSRYEEEPAYIPNHSFSFSYSGSESNRDDDTMASPATTGPDYTDSYTPMTSCESSDGYLPEIPCEDAQSMVSTAFPHATETDVAHHDQFKYTQCRSERDRQLLNLRNRGFSYRKIREMGNFVEAESTLRGRVRILTKDKAHRVRNPKWTTKDVNLLHTAVSIFGRISQIDRHGRLPWQKVADWMIKHGASYPFAPATCSRKWEKETRGLRKW